MPRPIVEPLPVRDGMSPGDTVIGHTASFYSDGSLNAFGRPRPGGPVQEAAAAPEAPLPMTGVSRQLAGTEIQRLRAQAEAGRRDLQGRYFFTASGAQVSDPAVLAMRAELAAEVDAAEAEAERLANMTDDQVRAWAGSRGVR
jgi:hypothetical protein